MNGAEKSSSDTWKCLTHWSNRCLALPCHVLPCRALPCLVLHCHAFPCLALDPLSFPSHLPHHYWFLHAPPCLPPSYSLFYLLPSLPLISFFLLVISPSLPSSFIPYHRRLLPFYLSRYFKSSLPPSPSQCNLPPPIPSLTTSLLYPSFSPSLPLNLPPSLFLPSPHPPYSTSPSSPLPTSSSPSYPPSLTLLPSLPLTLPLTTPTVPLRVRQIRRISFSLSLFTHLCDDKWVIGDVW